MEDTTNLRRVLEAVRRHVERATAGTDMEPQKMTVDLRFGLYIDERSMVRPVLRTASEQTQAPHNLRMEVVLNERPK